jgi:hypothetical protein
MEYGEIPPVQETVILTVWPESIVFEEADTLGRSAELTDTVSARETACKLELSITFSSNFQVPASGG